MAALAVAAVGLLPSLHVHAHEDETVIHGHVIDGGSAHDEAEHHERSLDRDDHLAARILPLYFETASAFSMIVTLAVATESIDITEPAVVRQRDRTTLLPTHDPPLRFVSSPAPPVSA
jgi:hypothetical protein